MANALQRVYPSLALAGHGSTSLPANATSRHGRTRNTGDMQWPGQFVSESTGRRNLTRFSLRLRHFAGERISNAEFEVSHRDGRSISATALYARRSLQKGEVSIGVPRLSSMPLEGALRSPCAKSFQCRNLSTADLQRQMTGILYRESLVLRLHRDTCTSRWQRRINNSRQLNETATCRPESSFDRH